MNKEVKDGTEQPENKEANVKSEESENIVDQVNREGSENKDEQKEALQNETVNNTAELEAKLAEEKDRFLRLYSEFDNYKKRTMRERTDLLKSAGEDVFKLILPVLDDFERAMKANESVEDINALKEGFGLIYHKLKNNLNGKGLEEMNCTGETFNSDSMEAIANIPAAAEEMKSKVVDVLEKGYTLNGKVIRFAKVVVGN